MQRRAMPRHAMHARMRPATRGKWEGVAAILLLTFQKRATRRWRRDSDEGRRGPCDARGHDGRQRVGDGRRRVVQCTACAKMADTARKMGATLLFAFWSAAGGLRVPAASGREYDGLSSRLGRLCRLPSVDSP